MKMHFAFKPCCTSYAYVHFLLFKNGVQVNHESIGSNQWTHDGLTLKVNPKGKTLISEDCIEIDRFSFIQSHTDEESDILVKLKDKICELLKKIVPYPDNGPIGVNTGKVWTPFSITYTFYPPLWKNQLYFDCGAHLPQHEVTIESNGYRVTNSTHLDDETTIVVGKLPFYGLVDPCFSEIQLKEAFQKFAKALFDARLPRPDFAIKMVIE